MLCHELALEASGARLVWRVFSKSAYVVFTARVVRGSRQRMLPSSFNVCRVLCRVYAQDFSQQPVLEDAWVVNVFSSLTDASLSLHC